MIGIKGLLDELMKLTAKNILMLILTLSLCGCEHEDKEKQAYQNLALEALDDKDYQESLINLKMGLKLDPANPEMRKLLGLVWLKLGDPKACVEQLVKSEELGLSHNAIVLPLAKCHLYQSNFDEVLAQNFTDQQFSISNQDVAALLALKAQASLAKDDPDKALDYIDKALALAPSLPKILFAKAHWLAATHEPTLALEVLEGIIKENPKYAKSWGLMADLHRLNYNLKESENAYSQAILHADSQLDLINYYLYRALVRIYQQSSTEAMDDLQVVSSLQKNHPGVAYLKGMIALSKHNYAQAIDLFQESVANHNQLIYGQYFLGLSYTLSKNYHAARDHLAHFLSVRPKHLFGNKLQALVEIQLGELNHAIERLTQMLENNPKEADIYHLLGEALLKNGELQRGAHYLSEALKIDPSRVEAQLKLGLAEIDMDNTDTARWAFSQVLEQYPQYKKALLLKFINEYRANRHDTAKGLASTYIKHHPKDTLGYTLKGMVLLREESKTEALELFNKALAIDPNDPNANTHLANLASKEGHPDKAQRYLETILQKYQHTPTLLKLSSMAFRAGNAQKGVAYLHKVIETNPHEIASYLALARLNISMGRLDKAMSYLKQVPQDLHQDQAYLAVTGLLALSSNQSHQASKLYTSLTSSKTALQKVTLEFAAQYAAANEDWPALESWSKQLVQKLPRAKWVQWQANAQWQQKNYEGAKHTLSTWLATHPNDDKSKMWYANYLMRTKDYSLAENVYLDLLRTQPLNPIVYNNLAWILKDSSPQEAKSYIEKALTISPNWPSALKTQSAIYKIIESNELNAS